MSKGFENGNLVPLAGRFLRSRGTCESISPNEQNLLDRKLYPILDRGAMMSAQNTKAYLEACHEAYVKSVKYKMRQKLLRMKQPAQVSQLATVLPFKGV